MALRQLFACAALATFSSGLIASTAMAAKSDIHHFAASKSDIHHFAAAKPDIHHFA